jgi:hypothetical protein
VVIRYTLYVIPLYVIRYTVIPLYRYTVIRYMLYVIRYTLYVIGYTLYCYTAVRSTLYVIRYTLYVYTLYSPSLGGCYTRVRW